MRKTKTIYIDTLLFMQFDVKTFEIVSSPILEADYDYDKNKDEWIDRNAVVVKDKSGIYQIRRERLGYFGRYYGAFIIQRKTE